MTAFNIRVLTNLNDVQGLSESWLSLLENSSCDRAFSSPEWFMEVCGVFHKDPCVFVVEDSNGVCAILPLVLTKTPKCPKGRLAFCDEVFTDYNDMIVPSSRREPPLASALVDAVVRHIKDIDAAVFMNIRADSSLRWLFENVDVSESLTIVPKVETLCPFLDVSAGWAKLLETRGHRFRYGLKRVARKFEDKGYTWHDDPSPHYDIPALVEKFFELQISRFHALDRGSLFENVDVQQFCRKVLPAMVRRGAMSIHSLLDSQGNVVAMLVATRAKSAVGFWNQTFDHKLDQEGLSPGAYMLARSIESAIATGAAEYDFLRGAEGHKMRWAPSIRKLYSLSMQFSHESTEN